MREIDLEDTAFNEVLNKMYQEFNPDKGTDMIIPFAEHVRHKYGIHIGVRPNLERGPGHYELTRASVENEARYNWLVMEWT